MNKINQMAQDFLAKHGDICIVEDIEGMAEEWVFIKPDVDTELFTQNFVGFWNTWREYADLWCAEHKWVKKIADAIAEEATNEEEAHSLRYGMLMEATNNAGIYTISNGYGAEESFCAVWRNIPISEFPVLNSEFLNLTNRNMSMINLPAFDNLMLAKKLVKDGIFDTRAEADFVIAKFESIGGQSEQGDFEDCYLGYFEFEKEAREHFEAEVESHKDYELFGIECDYFIKTVK